MNVFVDAARLFVNLGALGDQLGHMKGAGQFDAEYLASSVTSMAADTVSAGMVSAKLFSQYRVLSDMKKAGLTVEEQKPVRDDMKKDNSSLILKALNVVDILEMFSGFGPPCKGDNFTTGSDDLTKVCEKLKLALAGAGWQGGASTAYDDQVAALMTLVDKMAEKDRRLADLVNDQAERVTDMRLLFGILKDLLLVAFAIEVKMKLALPQPGGLVAATTFAAAVFTTSVLLALAFLGYLTWYSIENGNAARDVISDYRQLAKGVDFENHKMKVQNTAPAAKPGLKAAPAAESTVSDFEAISRSMSGPSAAPRVGMLAGSAPEDAANQSTQTSEDDTTRGRQLLGAPDETTPSESDEATPSASGGATPFTPAYGVPTLAPLTKLSGQAAKISGHVSQHMNLVSQTVEQIQEIVSMVQEAAPAEEVTDDVEEAEAASGPQGAERAPAELAAAGGTPTYTVA